MPNVMAALPNNEKTTNDEAGTLITPTFDVVTYCHRCFRSLCSYGWALLALLVGHTGIGQPA